MMPIVQINDNLDVWSERTTSVAQNAKQSDSVVHLDSFDAFVFTDYATEVADLRKWVAELDGEWAFRGQRDHRWPLDASIDRASRRSTNPRWDGGSVRTGTALWDPAGNERKMLDQFRGRAHHFLKSTPAEDEALDWLALMQHYGAPTRLLDWSRSPYVATYFAIEEPTLKCSRGHALWAISLDWLRSRSNGLLRQKDPFFSTAAANDARKHAKVINILLQSDMEGIGLPNVVIATTNFRLNERQAAQQGLFLFALNTDYNIRQSLLQMMVAPSVVTKPVLRKLILNPSIRLDLLRELQRMNITGASLFPGLDGFSRGLRVNLELDVERMKQAAENQD